MAADASLAVSELVSELIGLQASLVAMSVATFGAVEQLPRYGVLHDKATIWGFSRHGVGVRFIDIRTLITVDFDIAPELPKGFTLWRLRIYADSRGSEVLTSLDDDSIVQIAGLARLKHGGHLLFGKGTTRVCGPLSNGVD